MCGRRDESLLLDDLLDAAARLVELGEGRSADELEADRDRSESILYNLIVLGEAAKRLASDTRERFGDVPWSAMAGARDRVVHHYEGVDWEVIGEIIQADLPALLPRLAEIRDELRMGFDTGTRF